MGSGKEGEPLNPKEMMKMKKPSRLGPKAPNPKSKFNNKKKKLNNIDKKKNKNDSSDKVGAKKPKPQAEPISPSQQLNFFLDQFQSANNLQLSSLESDSLTGSFLLSFLFKACVLDLSQVLDQEVSTLGKQVKAAFGPSWKEVLCEGQLMEGKIDPGNPAVLIISASALRSLEFLRGLRPLTRECPAAKLFSKHMKVDDQVVTPTSRFSVLHATSLLEKSYSSVWAQKTTTAPVRSGIVEIVVEGYKVPNKIIERSQGLDVVYSEDVQEVSWHDVWSVGGSLKMWFPN
ncbi:hypothetical protein CK203_102227 [Vitis vinifera]|uniref:Protein CMSS1 n=1 Tax=Vitis vinifera TaxID=29760 RepID=A0A438BTA5_VITVI|nr:hypothetical protein CK203_102227 [Vitis vinifera]